MKLTMNNRSRISALALFLENRIFLNIYKAKILYKSHNQPTTKNTFSAQFHVTKLLC